jgi:hypothetical protein
MMSKASSQEMRSQSLHLLALAAHRVLDALLVVDRFEQVEAADAQLATE